MMMTSRKGKLDHRAARPRVMMEGEREKKALRARAAKQSNYLVIIEYSFFFVAAALAHKQSP